MRLVAAHTAPRTAPAIYFVAFLIHASNSTGSVCRRLVVFGKLQ